MEAETYLCSGFDTRLAIESKAAGWTRFGNLASICQPSRLRGIVVSPEYGIPFLTATQVFDIRPVYRKFLALEKTEHAATRFVEKGTILVTRSGSVGRATLACALHEGILLSDDLLRVSARDKRYLGWLYAYLRAPQVRAMASGAQYGHIIKHLEISHLEALPIMPVSEDIAADFGLRVRRVMDLRNRGYHLTLEAEARFERALGPLEEGDWGERGYRVRASSALMTGRRRFDASAHNPGVAAIRRHLSRNGRGFTSVMDAGYDVWLPDRFSRIPAPDGVRLLDSTALMEVNPDVTKRIADGGFGDPYNGRVEAGWVLMARSGQTYGIIGTAVLAEGDLEGCVVSDDVIRIKARDDASVKPGYLVTALSHPVFGRPAVKSLAYGSSIPHIDVADVAAHEIVRLEPSDESTIASLAEEAARSRFEADQIERQMAVDAGIIIDSWISWGHFG